VPEVFYYRGDRALFQQGPRVAIVGSRRARPDGLRRAAKHEQFGAPGDIRTPAPWFVGLHGVFA
jgi:hypothetical protein